MTIYYKVNILKIDRGTDIKMTTTTKEAVKDSSTWKRILYMVFFAFAYSIAEIVLIAVVIAQVLFKLLTGEANENMTRFGKQTAEYIYDIMLFQTFNTEDKPFPFASWPEA